MTGNREFEAMRAAHAALRDEARPEAVRRQHERGHLTAREALAALVDADTFVEYGGLAQPVIEGMEAPAEGVLIGTAQIAGRPVALVFYDYTVHGGSQSYIGHHKITRLFRLAAELKLPTICWLDGGGARPQDAAPGRRLVAEGFVAFAQLSGLVPTIGVVSQRAFAGHANLAGLCDCLIAVEGAALGIGGPPLVFAATGVRHTPEEIGPLDAHRASGVVDVVAATDAEAIAAARAYLAFFGPRAEAFQAPDAAALSGVLPKRAQRAYDVRRVIEGVCDVGCVFELKRDFGKAIVTALARLDGRAVGVIANQPMFLAGAIDSAAAEKAARFVQLCDAFDIPLLLLCDTPGILVGPEAESAGAVRRASRLLMALANARVPLMSVVLRKAFGMGFYIMGSQALRPAVLLAWPGAQYGGMGLEGAVEIAHGREIAALDDSVAREALRARRLEALRHEGSAVEAAARFLYDDVIDPADTRRLLALTMASFANRERGRPRRAYVDAF
jgi:acetyl-CoA carboxylase carboxyltransferase component